MDQVVKIIEYQYVIKAKFNPVKFNNLRPIIQANQKSKVMFKSKKAIITTVVIALLLIAVIIFIVVRNKKKKKKQEELEKNKNAQPPTTRSLRPQSSVIPKQDMPGSEKKPAPAAPAQKPELANNAPHSAPPVMPNIAPVGNNTIPVTPQPVVSPKAQPQVEEKKMTPLADKGISIENELNKPIDVD